MNPKRPNQLAKSIIDMATGQKPDRDPNQSTTGNRDFLITSGTSRQPGPNHWRAPNVA
jgi:hypothetical protein